MTVRAWFGRNLDHGGAGGPRTPVALELVSSRSSGEDGGEGAGPSTCSITLPSAGDAGEAAFLFFPRPGYPIGEMTGVLLFCSTGAAPVTGTVAAGF